MRRQLAPRVRSARRETITQHESGRAHDASKVYDHRHRQLMRGHLSKSVQVVNDRVLRRRQTRACNRVSSTIFNRKAPGRFKSPCRGGTRPDARGGKLVSLEHRFASLFVGLFAFPEVSGMKQASELRIDLRQCWCLRWDNCQMSRLQRRPHSQRRTGCNFGCDRHCRSHRVVDIGRYGLYQPHAKSLGRAPMVTRQHVAHCVSPPSFAHKSHCRSASRKTTMCIFVLTEIGV